MTQSIPPPKNVSRKLVVRPCPKCEGIRTPKHGKRFLKAGVRVRYQCRDCGKSFYFEPVIPYKEYYS